MTVSIEHDDTPHPNARITLMAFVGDNACSSFNEGEYDYHGGLRDAVKDAGKQAARKEWSHARASNGSPYTHIGVVIYGRDGQANRVIHRAPIVRPSGPTPSDVKQHYTQRPQEDAIRAALDRIAEIDEWVRTHGDDCDWDSFREACDEALAAALYALGLPNFSMLRGTGCPALELACTLLRTHVPASVQNTRLPGVALRNDAYDTSLPKFSFRLVCRED